MPHNLVLNRSGHTLIRTPVREGGKDSSSSILASVGPVVWLVVRAGVFSGMCVALVCGTATNQV